jgi:putative membrane protein
MPTFKNRLVLALKGVAMGAADVVPGVSGGTIAFITGIYEELIDTISGVSLVTFQTLFKKGFAAFWKAINGNFLLALGAGIALSILSLAKLITTQLEENPVAIWSFFFGLVAASIPVVARRVSAWSARTYFAFGVGAITAFLITQLPSVENADASWYLFVSGAIAICAMILPGISGSFILLLLGSYVVVLDAINDRDLGAIAIFGAGAVVGILSFSRVLKWMFKRYHNVTVALLSGFLLGSLNKIWPWKHALVTFTKYEGTDKEKVLVVEDENVWPWNYTEITGDPELLGLAIALALLGVVLIFGMDRLAAKKA